MDIQEPDVRREKMASGSTGVLVYLCPLVLETGVRPLPNVLVDAWPHIPGGDQLLSSSNTRGGRGHGGCQTPGAELRGDKWAGNTSGCVAEERDTTGWAGTRESVRDGAAPS